MGWDLIFGERETVREARQRDGEGVSGDQGVLVGQVDGLSLAVQPGVHEERLRRHPRVLDVDAEGRRRQSRHPNRRGVRQVTAHAHLVEGDRTSKGISELVADHGVEPVQDQLPLPGDRRHVVNLGELGRHSLEPAAAGFEGDICRVPDRLAVGVDEGGH